MTKSRISRRGALVVLAACTAAACTSRGAQTSTMLSAPRRFTGAERARAAMTSG